jgi:hypothetical protein
MLLILAGTASVSFARRIGPADPGDLQDKFVKSGDGGRFPF